MSKTMSLSDRPMGTSITPVLTTAPAKENTLVPFPWSGRCPQARQQGLARGRVVGAHCFEEPVLFGDGHDRSGCTEAQAPDTPNSHAVGPTPVELGLQSTEQLSGPHGQATGGLADVGRRRVLGGGRQGARRTSSSNGASCAGRSLPWTVPSNYFPVIFSGQSPW
jgi:hypothetical protein